MNFIFKVGFLGCVAAVLQLRHPNDDADNVSDASNVTELDQADSNISALDEDNATVYLWEEATEGDWNYNRPELWENKFPKCGGDMQSPIDIDPRTVIKKQKSPRDWDRNGNTLNPKYEPKIEPSKLVNNGHTFQVNGDFGILSLPDGDYIAKQFHFHHPSEHRVNGKAAAGELHIVHQKKNSVGASDNLAIVAILLEHEDNIGGIPADLKAKWIGFLGDIGFGDLPRGKDNYFRIDVPVDLTVLEDHINNDFWHYQGSLATPPCAEGVHWFVMQQRLPVTVRMMHNYAEVMKNNNNRPVQKLNERDVVENDLKVNHDEWMPVPKHHKSSGSKGAKKDEKEDDPTWSYENGGDWSSFQDCGGSGQSPIDIAFDKVSRGETDELMIDYWPMTMRKVANDGNAIKVLGDFGSVTLPDGDYRVKQLTFHFPSEHAINGQLASGEMHIVHEKPGGGLAVIAILLRDDHHLAAGYGEGETLEFMRSLGFESKLPESGEELEVDKKVDLNDFEHQLKGNYYHYVGSMTTPPCTPGVHWYVMQTPAPITRAMVTTFANVLYTPSNREVQPLDDRTIASSKSALEGEFMEGDRLTGVPTR